MAPPTPPVTMYIQCLSFPTIGRSVQGVQYAMVTYMARKNPDRAQEYKNLLNTVPGLRKIVVLIFGTADTSKEAKLELTGSSSVPI